MSRDVPAVPRGFHVDSSSRHCPRYSAGTLAETPTMEPIALSVSDAVKASGLGKTTLYEAMADVRLESRKVGRKRLFLPRPPLRLIEGEV